MTVWYEAAFREIKAVEVERESDAFVWVGGNKHKKTTEWRSFFKTWGEAHAWLLGLAEQELLTARRGLQHAQDKYGNVKGLRPPLTETGDTNGNL